MADARYADGRSGPARCSAAVCGTLTARDGGCLPGMWRLAEAPTDSVGAAARRWCRPPRAPLPATPPSAGQPCAACRFSRRGCRSAEAAKPHPRSRAAAESPPGAQWSVAGRYRGGRGCASDRDGPDSGRESSARGQMNAGGEATGADQYRDRACPRDRPRDAGRRRAARWSSTSPGPRLDGMKLEVPRRGPTPPPWTCGSRRAHHRSQLETEAGALRRSSTSWRRKLRLGRR